MGANKILRYAKLNQRHLLLNFSNNVIWVSAVQHYSDIGWPALISLDDEAESSVSSFRYHNTLYRQTAMFKINTSRRRERKGSNFERRERKKRANPLESTIHETKMSIILTKKKKTTRDPCENFFDVLRISLALSFFFQRSNSVKHDWQMITISKHKKQNKTGKKAFVETPSRSIKVRSNVRFADRQLRFVRDRIFTKKKKLNVKYKFLSLPVWTAASFNKTKQATFFISIRSNRFYQFSFLQLQPSNVSYSIRDTRFVYHGTVP